MSPEAHNKLKTHQELHDTIIAHFLTMPKPAVNYGVACKYRSDTGVKCFAGALIPDDMYSTSMEQTTAAGHTVGDVLRELGYEAPTVREYQKIHDDATNEVICNIHNKDVAQIRVKITDDNIEPDFSWPENPKKSAAALAEWRENVAKKLIWHGNKYGITTDPIIYQLAGV